MKYSVEYPATRTGVKRGLRARKVSQNRAAIETAQSPALVSMVLSGKARSQPCLDKLAAFINRGLRTDTPGPMLPASRDPGNGHAGVGSDAGRVGGRQARARRGTPAVAGASRG